MTGPGTQAPDWRSQTDLELTSLTVVAPNATADVGVMIRGVLELGSIVASKHGVHLETKFVQANLVAAVHPSALRQTLISTIGRLAQCMSSGHMSMYATLEDGQVKINVTGLAAAGRTPTDDDLIPDVIIPAGTSVEIRKKTHGDSCEPSCRPWADAPCSFCRTTGPRASACGIECTTARLSPTLPDD
jgi:hypothetical protein